MKARVGRPRPVFDTKGRPCPGPCLKARAGFNPARVSQLAASPLHHCCISSLPLLFSTAASLLLQSSLLLCTAATLLQRSLQQRCNSSAAIVSSPLHCCLSYSARHTQTRVVRHPRQGTLRQFHGVVHSRVGPSTQMVPFLFFQEMFIAENGSLLLKTGAYY